jgi:hypothetical protein
MADAERGETLIALLCSVAASCAEAQEHLAGG